MTPRLGLLSLPLVAALVGPAAGPTRAGEALEAAWRDVAWPLPRDQFPAGRAFACDEKHCGARLRMTLRPKVGFCNCLTGVSDDDELERVGDVDLLGDDARAGAAGRELAIGARSGRARLYEIGRPGAREPALSIAFNEKCDVVVATVTGARVAQAEDAVVRFLESPGVSAWIARSLGP